MLETIISDLKSSIEAGEGLINHVKYPKALCYYLVELTKLIGLTTVKSMVAGLVSSQVVKSYDGSTSKTEGMNHILLMGKPGTGKTTTSNLIAKIISAIGFLDPNMELDEDSNTETLSFFQKSKPNVLEEEIRYLHRSLKNLSTKTDQLEASISKVQNKISSRQVDGKFGVKITVIKDLEVSEIYRDLTLQQSLITEIKETLDKSQGSNTRIVIPYVQEGIVPEPEFSSTFIVAPRDMLVSGYVGQTAIKVKKRVKEAAGGVLFIDEAYNMLNMGSTGVESFSSEAISTLCGCMSKYNRNFVVIMAGYEAQTLEMLLTNDGMQRRFGHIVRIEDYTTSQVAAIFTEQLQKLSLHLHPSINTTKFIQENKDILGANGGITNQLASTIHLVYASERYKSIVQKLATNQTKGLVSPHILTQAMDIVARNIKTFKVNSYPPLSMYQ